ncbi:MAG TPA: succinylglutamate desuccinylase/aspartoacylase family protein [Methanobacterium sp.]|nr:succinylglutamate desuccinylase/aspartoacylase family protein [Methanobacterium sp.]
MKSKFIILSIFVLTCIIMSLGVSSAVTLNNTSSVSVQILDKNVHGNVMKNPAVKKYLSNTSSNQKMVSKLKQGSLVYRLGNGKGKTILITGGIHGNEPQGALAVAKFMNYLKKKKINGTIYIVPFAIPIDTEKNSRNYVRSSKHYDPNREANVAGTPTNKILKFALSHKVNYIIDVHAGLGVNSKGMVYFRNSPEKKWAKYIQKKTGAVIKTNSPGGTFRSEASKRGIKAITMEVDKKFNIGKTSNEELKMLLCACVYLHVIN